MTSICRWIVGAVAVGGVGALLMGQGVPGVPRTARARGAGTRHGIARVPAASGDVAQTTPHVLASYGKLPLAFEPNRGQSGRDVQFLARGVGYTVFLTPDGAVITLQRGSVRTEPQPAGWVGDPRARQAQPDIPRRGAVSMTLLGGTRPAPAPVGLETLPGQRHYFIGNDPTQWHTHVPTYARVRYREVYPGIDLIYYGQQQLEYDFLVAPGADPNAIRLRLDGAQRLRIDGRGDVVLDMEGADLRLRKPFIY